MTFSIFQIRAAERGLAEYALARQGGVGLVTFDASGEGNIDVYNLHCTIPESCNVLRVIECGEFEGFKHRVVYLELECGLVLRLHERDGLNHRRVHCTEIKGGKILEGADDVRDDAAAQSQAALARLNSVAQSVFPSLAQNFYPMATRNP